MEYINLTNELSIKKIEPYNGKDLWLIEQLNRDALVGQPGGYLSSLVYIFKDTNYLYRGGIYHAPYSIYYNQDPIGYLEISSIFLCLERVDIAYALIEKARGNGHMTKVLRSIAHKILTDANEEVNKVALMIDSKNLASQAVAKRAGFFCEDLNEKKYIIYEKTKKMLSQENSSQRTR